MTTPEAERRELDVLPLTWVPNWFLEEVVEAELAQVSDDDQKAQARAQLVRDLTETMLQGLVAYMKENDLFFAVGGEERMVTKTNRSE